MEPWRSKAMEYFPEFRELIESEPAPMSFWTELRVQLAITYSKQPLDETLIGKIFDYAEWCFVQPPTGDIQTDLSSAVAVGFVEDLPLDKNIANDLYRWMSEETFRDCENLFRYMLDDEEFKKFSETFHAQKRNFSGPSRF